ncbi:hypothetical protein HOK68_03240, partial [Candidatus Woesearchaeota archaeon]|nr:hypothetical protein [Candidatus Woesearchaeota archaeon]
NQSRIITFGAGLMSDSSNQISFGIGDNDNIEQLKINFLNGDVKVFNDISINQKLTIN